MSTRIKTPDHVQDPNGRSSNPIRKYAWAIILLLLIALLLIWFLAKPSKSMFVRENYFIPNQIILTTTGKDNGTIQSKLEMALENIPGGEIVKDSLIVINLSETSDSFCPGLPQNLDNQSNFAVALAQFDSSSITVEEVLAQISNSDVTAEPNLITGSPDYPVGSTVSWPFAPAEPDDYVEQWAFKNIEVNNFAANEAEHGAIVRLVIFDTVPTFIDEESVASETVTAGQTTFLPTPYPINWVEPNNTMLLTVGYGWEFAPPALEGASASEEEDMGLSHHGLFAAQMAHAVAPASSIELIRVLDSGTHGTLYGLILSFYDNLLRDGIKPQPTVVNMSLGIRIPPPKANFELPTLTVEALHTLVLLAECRDIVIVAASGNNSIGRFPPELAHLPADWSSVISVAASNMENQRSCFSNQGDIAAPGGDGRLPDDPDPIACEAKLTECTNGGCPYAVVGPIRPPNGSDEGLIFWEGSSFSAPMVAGLAARILAESSIPLSPNDVRSIIECGATEANFPNGIDGHPDRHIGEGIINVTRTLEDCMP